MRFPDASNLTTALVLIAPAAFGAAPEVLFHDAKSRRLRKRATEGGSRDLDQEGRPRCIMAAEVNR
jgi:hypothetical protein